MVFVHVLEGVSSYTLRIVSSLSNAHPYSVPRPLAWQEALIALACIFQKFDLIHNDPSYQLSYKYSLTVKPRDFKIRAIPRVGAPSLFSYTPGSSVAQSPVSSLQTSSRRGTMASLSLNGVEGVDLYLAYGSNSGTCRDFAQRVGSEATVKGTFFVCISFVLSHKVNMISLEQ